MKLDRLIGILSILLQKDQVTAPYLAELFEVSRRTITRDIDVLCRAGIPVITRQGSHGGISILENYRVDRTVFTKTEMQELLAGLRSLDSIHGTNRYAQLMEKLSAGSSSLVAGSPSMLIDLSSWDKDSLAPKIGRIRQAIDEGRELEFLYFSPKEESRRRIEPYYLVFRWSSWYVWGWCAMREDFRLFKLNRMAEVRVTEKCLPKREVSLPDLSNQRVFPGGIPVKVLFKKECKWRLVEEYGPDCFEEQDDGRLLFQTDHTNRQDLIAWILSFGDQAKLLEPEALREEIRAVAGRMHRMYS